MLRQGTNLTLFDPNTKETIKLINLFQHNKRQELLRESELQPLKEEINALFSENDEYILDVCQAQQDDCDLVYVMSSKQQLYILLNGTLVDRQTVDIARFEDHYRDL